MPKKHQIRNTFLVLLLCISFSVPTSASIVFPSNTFIQNSGDTIQKVPLLTSFDQSRHYWIVLIAIGNYPGPGNDLPYSLNELKSFKATLTNGGKIEESHIRTLTNEMANKSAVIDAIQWLATNAKINDVVIFYFIGHGGHTPTNEVLLLYDGSLFDGELDTYLDTIHARNTIIILDSCYSGGFIKELSQFGRIILTACDKSESTYQTADLQSGIFGYFFNYSLDHLTKTPEMTYTFTWFLVQKYMKSLNEQLNQNYSVHPQLYDGCLRRIPLVDQHSPRVWAFIFSQIFSHLKNRNIFVQ
jgi:hypothetical protein